MTPDVKGLLAGAGQVDPAAERTTHPGRRTADSPFAILLASSTPHEPAVAEPSAPAEAAIAELEVALAAALDEGPASGAGPSSLARRLGTPTPGLEPQPARTTALEEELEATESSLPPVPSPIPTPAGTGVVLPLPLEAAPRPAQVGPPPADPAASHPASAILADAARGARPGPSQSPPRARPLHEQLDMREGASSERREQLAGGSAPVAAASPTDPSAPPRPPAAPATASGQAPVAAQAPAPAPATGAAPAVARGSAPPSEALPSASAEPLATPAAPEVAPRMARRADRRGTHQDQPLARPGVAARQVAGRNAPSTDGARPAPPPPAAAGQALVRELGTGARMAQASRAATPLREPLAAKGVKAAHPAEGGPPAHLAPQPPPAAPEPVTRPVSVPRAAPLAPPEPPQQLPGGTILPHTAHLRLESEALGDLSLHLRVRDGVAHLRVEGEQAGQLAGRGQELQRALAAEGLKLGQLEVERPAVPSPAPDAQARASADQGAPQRQHEQAERDEASPGPRTAAAVSSRRPSGRATAHHVEA